MVLPGASIATNETVSRIETACVVAPTNDQLQQDCVLGVLRMMRWNTSSHHRSAQRTPSLRVRSEEHTSELQSRGHLVSRLLLEKIINNSDTHCLLTFTKVLY